MRKQKKSDSMRRQKDLKILHSFVYKSITGDRLLHIHIMDRKTGKIYAGNIHKTYNKLKDWKERK